jgi:hypothetical protein
MTAPKTLLTPYDGSSRLFQIGLKPLALADWIDVDEGLAAQLAEKRRIFAAHPAKTLMAEPGTEAAQAELLSLLVDHLPARFPDRYRREGHSMLVGPDGDKLDLRATPPIHTAALLVQEDLVILRKRDAGWTLVAAALAFPSSWLLEEKFGRPMHAIHAPVPGFGEGTRPAQLIERMFDNMRPETPMIRWNWSLYGDDRLYHPDVAGPDTRRFGADMANIFLRVERQTLRRLPGTGDIVFTIRIHLDPLAALEAQPDAGRIATALAEQLLALDPAQLDYKGLTLERDQLVARLRRIG